MNVALILSGGAGTRLGTEIPKQYIEVVGKPVIAFCLGRLFRHEGIDAVQIVAEPAWREKIEQWLPKDGEKFRGFSKPGENRQMSILHGLEDIRSYAADTDYVLVHDAARPLLSEELISACLDAKDGYDGVLPVLPMKDTVYSSSDGKTITGLLKRSEVFAGQAPELYQVGKYYDANRQLLPDKILQINGAAEPAVMAGMEIALIPGDETNFKITTRADLERTERGWESGWEFSL